MFAVVRFVEDNSVAVVSTAWFVDEHTVRWPGSRNLNAYHKLLLAHEALPPITPQYSVIDVGRTNSYIDARAVEWVTVEQSSDGTSDCTSRPTHFNTRYAERKRVPLRYSSDDGGDHREETKGGSCHAPTMYPVPPPPYLPQPAMFHSPQRSPVAGPSIVRLPTFHDTPPILVPNEAAIHSTFYASRSEILSPFSPRVTNNTSSSESISTSNARFDSLQSDVTALLDLVRRMVSTLSTVTSRLQALESQMARSFSPPTTSKPAVMPAMFKSPARTQQELDERETELANSQVYDVVLKSLCRMGGTDVADTIRHMMSFLIHNDLAVSMNWSGVCNKRAACDLLSMELVRDAILSQQRYADVSGEELLVHMRRWYRNARDRAGGRTKRITKPPKSKNVDLDAD